MCRTSEWQTAAPWLHGNHVAQEEVFKETSRPARSSKSCKTHLYHTPRDASTGVDAGEESHRVQKIHSPGNLKGPTESEQRAHRGDSCAVKSVSRRCPSQSGLAAKSGGKSGATDPEINLNSREATENPSAAFWWEKNAGRGACGPTWSDARELEPR